MGKNGMNEISIYIYHPDNGRRTQLQQVVNNIIVFENLNMNVMAVAGRTARLLEIIREQKDIGVYFISFDANQRGVELAYRIREVDPWGFVIGVVSRHRRRNEALRALELYRLRPMDCIDLDEAPFFWENRIKLCMMEIWKSYLHSHPMINSALCEKTKDGMERVKMDCILYIESDIRPHWITICHEKGEMRLRKTLKEVEGKLDARFIRCHRSFIVNMHYIQKICKKEKSILLSNQKILYYADRQKNYLLEKVREYETGKSLFTAAD